MTLACYFAFTIWCKRNTKTFRIILQYPLTCVTSETILTLNSLSRIKLRLGQVEELVCSRMKYSRLYVILLHLVLSAKSVYIFWPGLMALAPHAAPSLHPTHPTIYVPHITIYPCPLHCRGETGWENKTGNILLWRIIITAALSVLSKRIITLYTITTSVQWNYKYWVTQFSKYPCCGVWFLLRYHLV